MARGRAANGSGMQPRQRKDGTWEGRFTVGIDPGTGKTIRKSVYGKTSAEVAEKIRAATASIDNGSYLEPQRMPLKEWLDIWLSEYTLGIKDSTRHTYTTNVERHIKPALGRIHLCELSPHECQMFINQLLRGSRGKDPLSVKTVKNILGTLTKALADAERIRYIGSNPATGCVLPKQVKADIKPFEVDEIQRFNEHIKNAPSGDVMRFALLTGMRLSEILGLRWSRVNFQTGMITVDAQMSLAIPGQGRRMDTPKNGKARSFKAPPVVLDLLKVVRQRQLEDRLKAGAAWLNDLDLAFTDAAGRELPHNTVEKHFRKALAASNITGHRFHDLRHTFATEAIRAGVDVKTVSETLGHASVAFTLDVYAGVTDAMQTDAANKLQALFTARDGQ